MFFGYFDAGFLYGDLVLFLAQFLGIGILNFKQIFLLMYIYTEFMIKYLFEI